MTLTSVLLAAWEFRPEVLLTLGLAAALHLAGWRRLRQRSSGRFRAGWRPAAYLGGLAVLALSILSPIDALSGQLFFMHMIQHLLMISVAAPLLLVANPLPFFLWGLPRGLRREAGRLLARGSAFRRALRATTPPGLMWLLFVAAVVGWHDPSLYDAALRSDVVHDLEHLTFFGSAVLFWWHVTQAAPRVRGRMSRAVRIGLLLAMVPPMALTGMVIAFSTQPIYGHYTEVPRLWGLSVMEDQTLSGMIMWIPGGMMFILAALFLIAQIIWSEDRKKPLPEAAWAGDESMLAPGLKK